MVCAFSGFRREIDEICTLLGCYAAYGGSSLSTFRDNLSFPFSRAEKSDIYTSSHLKKVVRESKVMVFLTLEDGPR